jgi:hypothetical protein
VNPNPQTELRPDPPDVAVPEPRPDEPVEARPPSEAWLAFCGFCYLVRLSFVRQARARLMVLIAVGLLVFATLFVGITTLAGRWGMGHWRWRLMIPGPLQTSAETRTHLLPPSYVGVLATAPQAGFPGGLPWYSLDHATNADKAREELRLVPAYGPRYMEVPYERATAGMETLSIATAWSPESSSLQQAVAGSVRALLDRSGFLVFSNWIVFGWLISFLLPIWSLSFATDALGGDREAQSLIWVLARPIPRPAVYLAKYLALLPWSIGLNVGGFGLLCLAAGSAGLLAFRLYWPAVLLGTLAFSSLFHLMGASVRKPAIVAIVYAFFLETILGNMPGTLKRISVSFYTRCVMFDEVERLGVSPVRPSVYMPVDGATACGVLVGLTVGLLLVGMVVFARSEYREES